MNFAQQFRIGSDSGTFQNRFTGDFSDWNPMIFYPGLFVSIGGRIIFQSFRFDWEIIRTGSGFASGGLN